MRQKGRVVFVIDTQERVLKYYWRLRQISRDVALKEVR